MTELRMGVANIVSNDCCCYLVSSNTWFVCSTIPIYRMYYIISYYFISYHILYHITSYRIMLYHMRVYVWNRYVLFGVFRQKWHIWCKTCPVSAICYQNMVFVIFFLIWSNTSPKSWTRLGPCWVLLLLFVTGSFYLHLSWRLHWHWGAYFAVPATVTQP